MRDYQPGGTHQFGFGIGITRDQLTAGFNRQRIILQLVEIVCGRRQHHRGIGMIGEGFGELERAANDLALDDNTIRRRRDFQVFTIGIDRGITGFGRFPVLRIIVCRAFVFERGIAIVAVFQHQSG